MGSFELPPEQQYDHQRKEWGQEWASALFTLIQKNLSITPSDLEGNREIGEILSLIEAVYDN